jgi:hypothetical protein
MAAKFFNLAQMISTTIGTGPVTLVAATSGYRTFVAAGVANGDLVSYSISNLGQHEYGLGVVTISGSVVTMSRMMTGSTLGVLLPLDGSAIVTLTPRAEDLTTPTLTPGSWSVVTTGAAVSPAVSKTLYVVTGQTTPIPIALSTTAAIGDAVAVYMADYTAANIVTVDAGTGAAIGGYGQTHRIGAQYAFYVYRCVGPSTWIVEWDPVMKPLRYRATNAQVGVLHGGSLLYMDSTAGARTILVPSNTTDPLPVGFQTEVMRFGANSVTLVPDVGVTMDIDGALALPHVYSRGVLTKVNPNEWTWSLYGSALINLRSDIPALTIRDSYFSTKDGAQWMQGGPTGPMAIQDASGQWWQIDVSRGSMVTWFGAVADNGVTNNHAAFVLADSFGSFTVPPGTFGINSATVLANEVTFADGGKINVATGITLTLNGGMTAGLVKVFTGVGAVAGLRFSRAEWFARDLMGTATDATAPLQLWLNSVVTNGECLIGAGSLTITGVTQLAVSNGQKIKGAGSFATQLYAAPTSLNFFLMTGASAPELHGMSFDMSDYTQIPSAGSIIEFASTRLVMSDVRVRNAYSAFYFRNGASDIHLTEFTIVNPVYQAIRLTGGVNDFYAAGFSIDGVQNWVDFTSTTGAFTLNENVTFAPSGATGKVFASRTALRYQISKTGNIIPLAGDTMTGLASGFTGVVSAVTRPFQNGALRLDERVQAAIFERGDIVGGVSVLSIDSTVNVHGSRPEFCKFTDVFFDSGDTGVTLNNCSGMDFEDCWFSSRPSAGCTVNTASLINFNGCDFINNGQDGLIISSTASQIAVHGGSAVGNSGNAASTYSGIRVKAGAADFSITNVQGGSGGLNVQLYDVIVEPGTSNNYVISNINNGKGTVSDGGTGANKVVEKYLGVNRNSQWHIVQKSAVSASVASVTETALATYTIPAGSIGANGVIRVSAYFSFPNSANAKTMFVRLGGLTGTAFLSNSATTNAGWRYIVEIYNNNSQSSQVGGPASGAIGANNATTVVSAVNTAINQDLVISGLTNGTETLTLNNYIIEICYGV